MTPTLPSTLPLTLSTELLTAAFPYHCAFDRRLSLVNAGKLLRSLLHHPTAETRVDTLLEIMHPAVPFTFDAIFHNLAEAFVLRHASGPTVLEGSMVYVAQHEIMVFLGSPIGIEPGSGPLLGLGTDSSYSLPKQVMETMGYGIAVADLDGIATFVNPALVGMVGQPASRLVGAPLLDIIHPDDHNRVRRLSLTWMDEQPSDLELRMISADGSFRHVQINCVALQQNGRRSGIVCVFSDMTKRRQTEDELKQAHDRAQEISFLKSDFLATMSHEMRTPLNSIIGVTELLADSPVDATQRELVQMVRRAGERLLDLVNDVLDFTKMEAGQLSLTFAPFDLRACLESCLDAILPSANAKGLSIGYLLDLPAPQRIYGDELRLRQILVNLLENAVRHTERGEINLTVTPIRLDTEEPTYELEFMIQDTGIGIPPEHRDRMFEGFNQLSLSTSGMQEGAGLALAVSHRLCHAMGGHMWLESGGIHGKGTTICFTVPTAEAVEAESKTQWSPPEPLQGRTVVFVLGNARNSPLWRNLIVLVESWSMRARLCTTFEEVSAFEQNGGEVDAILLEESLFEEQVASTMSPDNSPWAKTPLIVLTSGKQAGRSSSRPNIQFIDRPVRVAQFRKLLHRVLSKPSASTAEDCPAIPLFDARLAERRPLRMLIVEDNRVNQLVVQRMLGRLGYTTEIAEDGAAALEACNKQQFDLVFMDIHMPVMNGLETARRLREQEAARGARHRTRIVALTANDALDDRAACLAAGMDDHLSKPVRIAELRRVIEF